MTSLEEQIEQACPNVFGNPFIPHTPLPAQALFLGMHTWPKHRDKGGVFECLYGGAAGGGKSDALLMAAAQYAWKRPEFSGLLIRRSYAELAKADALMDRALKWWKPRGVHWNGTDKVFTFPSGAKVELGYLQNQADQAQYQGAAYQFVGWDELTHHPDDSGYRFVSLSRLRRPAGSTIPLRALSASNPGSAGHAWVKRRFLGDHDPQTGAWLDPMHPFIPARVIDNPYLDVDEYVESLSHLHPTLRRQMLEGDWDAREPGDYFRPEWFGPLLDDTSALEGVRVRWWDLAASESTDAARTAGVRMVRLPAGVMIVEHSKAFRATPGKRDAKIVQTAKEDGPGTVVGLEIEPGSGGPAQFESLSNTLRAQGFQVVGRRPKAEQSTSQKKWTQDAPKSDEGKARRAEPVAALLEKGFQRRGEGDDIDVPWHNADAGLPLERQVEGIRCCSGPWVTPFFDEIGLFPGDRDTLKDQVDALSGAWAYLKTAGRSQAPRPPIRSKAGAERANVHPALREDPRNRASKYGKLKP